MLTRRVMVKQVSVRLCSGFWMPPTKFEAGFGSSSSYVAYMRVSGRPPMSTPEHGYVTPNQPRTCWKLSPSSTEASKISTRLLDVRRTAAGSHSKKVVRSGQAYHPVKSKSGAFQPARAGTAGTAHGSPGSSAACRRRRICRLARGVADVGGLLHGVVEPL